MKFNINNYVRVRLTDKGRDIHKNRYDDLMKYHRRKGYIPPFPYTPVKEDENGWSIWQLWMLMSIFGEHMYCGFDNVLEPEIEIVEEQ